MNIVRTALVAMLCGAPVSGALADMRELADELRAEPLSLFDWGLFQLERELQSARRDERDYIRTFYEASRGRIVIDATFFVHREEIEAVNAQRACYTRHHAIKLTLGIIDTDRLHKAPAANFRFGIKFSHRDPEEMVDQPDPGKIGDSLMDAVEIKVAIASDPDDYPFGTDMRCEGRLMSQDVFYDNSGEVDYQPE